MTSDWIRNSLRGGSRNYGIRVRDRERTMIQNMFKEGKIVPSEVTIKLLQRAMQENSNDKFLIDGFPLNEENRAAFELVTGIEPKFVLFFDCPEEEMEKRLLGIYQGREYDNIETIRKRFNVYMESSLPVIEHYNSRGKINAAKPVEEVFEAVKVVFSPANEISPTQRNNEILILAITTYDRQDSYLILYVSCYILLLWETYKKAQASFWTGTYKEFFVCLMFSFRCAGF